MDSHPPCDGCAEFPFPNVHTVIDVLRRGASPPLYDTDVVVRLWPQLLNLEAIVANHHGTRFLVLYVTMFGHGLDGMSTPVHA